MKYLTLKEKIILVNIIPCILIGYVIGCISPAIIISKLLHRKLHEEGTGNYGASNVTILIGRGAGAFVMIFDVAKGAAAYLLCAMIFGKYLSVAGLIGGFWAIVGHSYPFYNKFRGGKGLATYGGVILAFDPLIFVIALIVAGALMFAVNHSFIFPYSASLVVAILGAVFTRDIITTLLLVLLAALVMFNHFPNLKRELKSNGRGVRGFVSSHILKDEKTDGK